MSGKWYTPDDIIRDLNQVGSSVLDVDNLGIIVADRPPPPLRISDDEEFQLEYYGMNLADSGADENMEPPDLAAIQQMLRMVNEIEENDEEEALRYWSEKKETANCKAEPVDKDEVLVISKLNPDVKEFFPKCVDDVTVNDSKTHEEKVKNTQKTSSRAHSTIEHRSPVAHERVSLKTHSEELKKITTDLKNKIKDVAETDSPRNKRKRNLAISTLLKLMSNSPKPSTSTNSVVDPTKLISRPDYGSPSGSKYNDRIEKLSNSSKVYVRNSPKQDEQSKEGIDPIADKTIKESIEKVTNWLNRPEAVSSNIVFNSGPVTFKRKDTSVVLSESKATEKGIPEKPLQLQCKEYVPSEDADELCKQFMERIQIRENREDIWTKLERQLKERDEQIKNGKIQKRKTR